MSANDNDLLVQQAQALLNDEPDAIANAANLSALIFDLVPRLNWAGFYFVKGSELVLGPFQGKVACTRIPIGSGVCGTSVDQQKTLRVADVHNFSGHIACDSASESEVVVPLFVDGRVIGVLDIDSPELDRFSESDQVLFEQLAQCWVDASDVGSLL